MAAIEFLDLGKKYGKVRSVRKLTASITEGKITGLLGPNGAGKSTSLRCLLGLAKPTSGEAKILGVHYKELKNPLTQIGAVLDSRGFHGGLTGKQNLKVMAAAAKIKDSRVDEVLKLVDLEAAANKKAKGYSNNNSNTHEPALIDGDNHHHHCIKSCCSGKFVGREWDAHYPSIYLSIYLSIL